MLHLALYQPVIAPNVGNAARQCVGLNAHLHVIGPTPLSFEDTQVKRAGLDYWPHLRFTQHPDADAFLNWFTEYRHQPATPKTPSQAVPEPREGSGPVTTSRSAAPAHPTPRPPALWLVTKFGEQRFDQPDYRDGDVVLCGNENHGLPPAWRDACAQQHPPFDRGGTLHIPILGPVRSYNLSNAAFCVLAHATLKAGLMTGHDARAWESSR